MDAGSQGSGQLVKDILRQEKQTVAHHMGWSKQEQAILQKSISAQISAHSYQSHMDESYLEKRRLLAKAVFHSGIYLQSRTILSLSPKQVLEAVRARKATKKCSEHERLGQNPTISVWSEKISVSPAEQIPWKPAGRVKTQQSCQQDGCSASSTEAAGKTTGPDHSLRRKFKEN